MKNWLLTTYLSNLQNGTLTFKYNLESCRRHAFWRVFRRYRQPYRLSGFSNFNLVYLNCICWWSSSSSAQEIVELHHCCHYSPANSRWYYYLLSRLCFKTVCLVGWGCWIHRLLFCRGIRPPPTGVLDMKLTLMVTLQ